MENSRFHHEWYFIVKTKAHRDTERIEMSHTDKKCGYVGRLKG